MSETLPIRQLDFSRLLDFSTGQTSDDIATQVRGILHNIQQELFEDDIAPMNVENDPTMIKIIEVFDEEGVLTTEHSLNVEVEHPAK